MKLFIVEVYVDDGWDRFTSSHRVLAENEKRACELAVNYWLAKDDTNIVRAQEIHEIQLNEGVIY